MRKVITGEQVAQLYNRDPFALPAWRAPVYQTPAIVTITVQLYRLIAWLVRLVARHPRAAGILALTTLIWADLGWVTLVTLAVAAIIVLAAWWWFWPGSFTRWIGAPARGSWRAWRYRRRWAGVLTVAGAAPLYRGRVVLPVPGKVSASRYVDRVQVRLVSGQSSADFADHAENLAHGFRRCCAGSAPPSPGRWCWSSSAATPWPPSSRPCPSRPPRT